MIDKATTIAILSVLQQCSGYALPEETLYRQLNISLPKPVTMQWMREHLQHTKDRGWSAFSVDEIDGSQKWVITDAGKKLLRQN